MPEPAPNAELLSSLGRLVRGLSALFWGLPLALIVSFHTARGENLKMYDLIPPIVTTGLLVYALWQMGSFQRQERVWRAALDRARVLALINFGLSPFLYFWNRVPHQVFFLAMLILFAISSVLFLGSVNLVLQRLGAMLPDETLRLETKQFGTLNLNLLFAALLAGLIYFTLGQFRTLPLWLGVITAVIDRGVLWFFVILILLPLAMTMALLWKTKQVILDSIFNAKS